jgi:metal-sulfur cluster biosynthetic enzyme
MTEYTTTTQPTITSGTLLEQVEAALRQVQDPCATALRADWSLVDLGLLVNAFESDDGELVVELTLTDPLCPFFEKIELMVSEAVTAHTGYERVLVDISSEVAWDPSRLQKGPLTVAGGLTAARPGEQREPAPR